jgi:SAM-dependent methyltransferase
LWLRKDLWQAQPRHWAYADAFHENVPPRFLDLPDTVALAALPAEAVALAASKFGVAPEIARSVATALHSHDAMFNFDREPRNYLESGLHALKAIQAALVLGQSPVPTSILDFGCGHGRVGRWLRAAYPSARITGAEVSQATVDFYGSLVSATAWHTSPDVRANETSNRFDLIWAGSVLTHLRGTDAEALIQRFRTWLSPGGTAIFSTHGRIAIQIFERKGPNRIEVNDLRAAMAAFRAGRYGYANYTNEKNYGHSFTPMDWITRTIAPVGRIVCFAEGGWRGFQDVTAFKLR